MMETSRKAWVAAEREEGCLNSQPRGCGSKREGRVETIAIPRTSNKLWSPVSAAVVQRHAIQLDPSAWRRHALDV